MREDWGYHCAQSLNRDLPKNGLRPLIAGANSDRLHLLLVAEGKDAELERYLAGQNMRLIAWLGGGSAARKKR